MHIVLFANTAWYLHNFRSRLMETLIDAGHRVTALAPHDSSANLIRALGADFVPIDLSQQGKNPLKEGAALLRLHKALRKLAPDWVLSFTIKCNIYAGLCSRKLPFRQIANISGLGEAFEKRGPLRLLVSALYKAASARLSVVFTQNPEDHSVLVRERLVPADRLCRLPGSGVDLERFRPTPLPPDDGKGRVVLMFGRVVPCKGYELLAGLLEEGREELRGLRFRVIGIQDKSRPASIELYRRLEMLASLGLLELMPSTRDIPSALGQCHWVMLPSTYNEGTPRSLLEALACGRPIITTDRPGCRDTVVAGENGYVVAPGDAASLREALARAKGMPLRSMEDWGRRSREIAEARFDERIVLKAYMDALRENNSVRP